MAMTFTAFKTYIMKSLWNENNTDLSNEFSKIVQAANNELNKLTKDWQRRHKSTVIAPETIDFDLTTNVTGFGAILSLVDNNQANTSPIMGQVTKSYLQGLRTRYPNQKFSAYFLEQDEDTGTFYLRLTGNFSASDPGDFTLEYLVAIPDYETADASWLEDEHLDLYQYCVMKHCAVFLREDERIELYANMMKTAMETAEIDDKHNQQFGGSPLRQLSHRQVP
jgi:hypothetical protein